VGHPLIERLGDLRPGPEEAALRAGARPRVVVLPGSRRSEIARLMEVFGETVALVARQVEQAEFVLPVVAHVEADVRAACAKWPVQPRIVLGEAEKFAAFRGARAALAKSGTVTLELALAGIPMVVGYRVPKIEETVVRLMTRLRSFVLPNLVLDGTPIPGFLQEDCNPANLSAALLPLLRDGPERAAQLAAMERIDAIMRLPDGETPSARAAAIILSAVK
jgi:lipid-A-disaccharide synthase